MCWLRERMILLCMVTLLLVLLPSRSAENQTHSNSEYVFEDLESRLSIASQNIDTVKNKLPKDLKELCKTFEGCNQTKIRDCNETKHVENNIRYVIPLDCSDIYLNGYRRNGLYDVWPQSRGSTGRLQVYCDMESNGGGWTVIQRRGDYGNKKDYFFREWNAYKRGFGDMLKEFWIGNDNLFSLTSQKLYQLRVNLTDWDGYDAYAIYDEFWVLDEMRITRCT
uniref:Lectin-like protein n=1 Tax=Chilobrachys guangxiensis TaxID=278060 RepID=B1P1K3_CHIGU|nr:lectin-like protein [Chilobrachys guangxiensis]